MIYNVSFTASYLFYPEEEGEQEFYDSAIRGKFVGETGGTSLSFPKLGRGPEIAADTISVHEKKIRRVPTVRASPTLTQFRTRPGCPRLPDPTPHFEPFQTTDRFSNANNLSPLSLSPSFSLLLELLRIERSNRVRPRFVIRNGIVNTNREYSLGNLGEKRGATKKYSKESSLYALRHVHEQRNIFAKMDISMYIYIYMYIPRFIDSLSKLGPPLPPPFLSMIYHSDPHSPLDRFTQLLFPRWSEKWEKGGRRKAAYRVENPG